MEENNEEKVTGDPIIKTEEKYILKDGKVVEAHDLLEWGRWFESEEGRKERRIGFDTVGFFEVSTVFLGLDYSFFEHRPQLFETMVFEKRESIMKLPDGSERSYHKSLDEQERYATIEEARAGHTAMIERVKEMHTWICDACKSKRADCFISVHTVPIPNAPYARRNWKYCNDNEECLEIVKTKPV